jgi:predicted NBD/HSP70 family sugar kinase
MNQKEPLLLGIDGGASKVAALQVNAEENRQVFTLGDRYAVAGYNELPHYNPNFTPQPLAKQLAEFRANTINLTQDEVEQGEVYVSACYQVVVALAKTSCRPGLLIGIGMPGLKTADKRGIAVLSNGPRIPDYALHLEVKLKRANIPLIVPIHKLGSDADYCGFGENHAKRGNFSDVPNAYYLGGGTGAADVMKLNGSLLPFDEAKDWIAKSWEMQNEDHISLEKFASAGGLQDLYRQNSGTAPRDIQQNTYYPLQIAERALTGDTAAVKTMQACAIHLALLLYERLTTLYCGWQDLFSFTNPDRSNLLTDHPFKGSLLDRIVIGQRLSELMRSRAGQAVLTKPLLNNLSRLIDGSTCLDVRAKMHYLHGTVLRNERFVLSSLREAAALGAAVDAYQAFYKNQKRALP